MKSTKEKVLEYLEANNRKYVSGQEIGRELFLTRSSVWKAIKSLKEAGYEIDGISNRGYRLVLSADKLSKPAIESFLGTGNDYPEIFVFDEVDSTNDRARQMAVEGADNLVVISDYQSKGRGRRGRSFFSPKGSGLYMSFLLKTDIEAAKATGITCMAAVAVCRAIERIGIELENNRTGEISENAINPRIKWVNDIFLNGKKICGILTEGFTSFEEGAASFVIIGIGMNLYEPLEGFPDDIKKTAGVLFSGKCSDDNIRNKLCGYVIEELVSLHNSNSEAFIDEYREKSMLIGSYVKINQFNNRLENSYARVTGIDNECRLLVEYDNGETEALSSGEVSVVKY